MSYNGRYVSFLKVVEDAYRDSGIDNIDFESAIAWTLDMIRDLGIGAAYIEKNTNGMNGMPIAIEVNNHIAIMPSDLVRLKSIRMVDISSDNEVVSTQEMVETNEHFYLAGVDNDIDTDNPRYKLDDSKIYTSFSDGYIQLTYLGYPIDESGFPMIPDDSKFMKALRFYIIYKLDWKRWRMNPSPQNASIKNDSEQQYLFYVAAAKTKYHTPSIDKLEAIKNMWLRNIPSINEHANGFSTVHNREMSYNNNRK